MKINLPVTQKEVFLEPGKPIVTKTDIKGIITYANDSFVNISGFSREELIGHSHNVVRHPDMPPEAFEDLWVTVKAGQPWRGFVKNRAKNGDHYWVEAFVTPITQDGRTIGYQSVRNTPSREDVAAAEALYRAVREKSARLPRTALPKSAISPSARGWMLGAGGASLAVAGAVVGGPVGLGLAATSALLALGAAAYQHYAFGNTLHTLHRTLLELDEGKLGKRIEAPAGPTRPLFVAAEVMRIHLRAMFADVLVSAREVEDRSRELDDAMRVLIKSTSAQGENVMQVAAAMEQMSVSINEVSNNTDRSLEAVKRTEQSAQEAMRTMEAGISSSHRVVDVVNESQTRISEVNASVEKIREVSQVINDIAEQTNLLALNAAIEAARAGEQGRGFAVVADEVRKLAERTRTSTKDIGTAVQDIISLAGSAVETMSRTAGEVTRSTGEIEASSNGLQGIWDASRQAANYSEEITQMLRQQSQTSHEVAISMERISNTVEQTNVSVQSIGDSTSNLRDTSSAMRALVKHLESALN
ncbi:methyl-accepting chemotaxis protein [Methyloversatilis thermotolerans]|uniref:methyl-accepting chemotaxis protein n=1 Tax=Methyloversatilis thermotolerans TaxID=1346290 RepID=UPI000375475D|nr:methyl-accepting chemotaxis protein [Methyloversatilis thermotolerans]